MDYIVMVVNATEKTKDTFFSVITQLDTVPTHLVINKTDTVAKEWAESQTPLIEIIESTPDFKTHGKSAVYKDSSHRLELSDALILIWDGKTKKGMDILNKAIKLQLEIYRN